MRYSTYQQFLKYRWAMPFIAVAALLLVATLALTVIAPQSAHAAGGVGGGGTGGGGSGGAQTGYGYGWYAFNTDGSGTGSPAGLRNGGTWGQVQATCRASNATKIIAFIVQTPSRTPQTAVVYNYTTSYGTYNLYLGNSGAPWESYATAQAQYASLPSYGVSTAGYTFGGPNGNVAWFCYDYQPQGWDISVGGGVNRTTASPGQVITWNHTVHNNGPAKTSGIKYGHTLAAGQYFGPTAIPDGTTISHTSTYTVLPNDVGTTLCRSTIAAPRSSTNSGSISSGPYCVSVPYNYSLIPAVSVSQTYGSVGTPVTIMPSVNNTGPTKSKPSTWQITMFTVGANKPVPNIAGGVSTSAPCAYFTANVTNCTSPYKDPAGNLVQKSNVTFGVNATSLANTTYTLTDLPVGTHVCFALSVNPASNASNAWRHSQPVCLVISKSPQVQVWGGDLRVGAVFAGQTAPATPSSINTSVMVKTDKSYGSWGEYGLIAPGSVTGAGSGSAFANGIDCTSACIINNLTFANNPSNGGFKPTTNIPNVAAAFPTTASTPDFVSIGHDAPSLHIVKSTAANVTIAGGTLTAGQWLVINAPTSVVTITKDIKYDDTATLNSIGDIPQLVIIAKQVNIYGSVGRVDGWLVASSSIYTCTTSGTNDTTPITASTSLTINLCQNQLTINGPVMTKQLYLQRTFGADQGDASGNPAEIINLRPDAYLWGTYQAAQSARLDTTSTNQLPPRF